MQRGYGHCGRGCFGEAVVGIPCCRFAPASPSLCEKDVPLATPSPHPSPLPRRGEGTVVCPTSAINPRNASTAIRIPSAPLNPPR